jgi:hypothetical protein
VNHQIFERKLHSWDRPGSTLLSVSVLLNLGCVLHSTFRRKLSVSVSRPSCLKGRRLTWLLTFLNYFRVFGSWWSSWLVTWLSCFIATPHRQIWSRLPVQATYQIRLLRIRLTSSVWWCLCNIPINEIRSEMKWEDPLNLSISLSGGKENNNDSPSNGEWSGKSSSWKSGSLAVLRIVV